MQYYKLEAIVLKKKVLRENDLAVSVYSRKKGKLNLVIRGGKNIISKLSGHVEPMSWVELNVVSTRGERDQIIGAQLRKSFVGIAQDVNKLGYANYFLEVVDVATKEGDGDERIFELLAKALERVIRTESIKDLALMRVIFVFKFLYLLGFRPQVDNQQTDQLVEYLVRGKVEEIIKNSQVIENQKMLFDVSQDGLSAQLDKALKSEEFIKEIN